MAYQPNQNPTWAERDGLDPNDSRRIIKGADFGAEFNNIKDEFDSIRSSLEHGNVASCYYNPGTPQNPTFGKEGLVYAYNIADVVAADTGLGSNTSTVVKFTDALPDSDGNQPSHFAFNFNVVSGTGFPTTLSISNASDNEVGFMAWHLVDGEWTIIPGLQCGFTLIVVDMIKGQ
jgi:hypothetical protein